MQIRSVTAAYFSATGNTEKVVKAIAAQVGEALGVPVETFDFTLPAARSGKTVFSADQLLVIGTPVYAGRVPNKLLPYVQTGFEGGGALAVPVVTFGNRNYDNGLIELRNEMENSGFHTVAAAAFAARHAFTDLLAPGRPDEKDMAVLKDFAARTAEKIQKMDSVPAPIAVKGEDPVGPYYTPLGLDGQPAKFLKAKPLTDTAKCIGCGLCAQVCPVGSVSAEDVTLIEGPCIKCQACIRKCPVGAKYFTDEAFLSHVAMLEKNYTRRAEPECFV